MSKSVKAVVRLLVPAGQAKPAPPVGPALGQAGLNIMAFCKDFNAKTADIKPGTKMGVQLTAYTDKTYEYQLKLPSVSYFLKQAAGIEDGAKKPGEAIVGQVSLKHVYEIAKVKQQDSPNVPLKSICKNIIGAAASMGIQVVPKPEDAA